MYRLESFEQITDTQKNAEGKRYRTGVEIHIFALLLISP